MQDSVTSIELDAVDRRILHVLLDDAGMTNQALAERVHVSPATCLRRVRRLESAGVIERRVALIDPDTLGGALQAVCEVTLDRQGLEHLEAFESRVIAHPFVQACYRVSAGPDFVLVISVRRMGDWEPLAQALFTQDANVRNIKTYFVTRRSKFAPAFHCLL